MSVSVAAVPTHEHELYDTPYGQLACVADDLRDKENSQVFQVA